MSLYVFGQSVLPAKLPSDDPSSPWASRPLSISLIFSNFTADDITNLLPLAAVKSEAELAREAAATGGSGAQQDDQDHAESAFGLQRVTVASLTRNSSALSASVVALVNWTLPLVARGVIPAVSFALYAPATPHLSPVLPLDANQRALIAKVRDECVPIPFV